MAKKRGGTPGTAKAPSTGAATTTPRRSSAISAAGSSTSMSRNGLSSSSSGASVALQDTSSDPATGGEDLEFTDATTPDELSRLTREQLVALILREREDKEEVRC